MELIGNSQDLTFDLKMDKSIIQHKESVHKINSVMETMIISWHPICELLKCAKFLRSFHRLLHESDACKDQWN